MQIWKCDVCGKTFEQQPSRGESFSTKFPGIEVYVGVRFDATAKLGLEPDVCPDCFLEALCDTACQILARVDRINTTLASHLSAETLDAILCKHALFDPE